MGLEQLFASSGCHGHDPGGQDALSTTSSTEDRSAKENEHALSFPHIVSQASSFQPVDWQQHLQGSLPQEHALRPIEPTAAGSPSIPAIEPTSAVGTAERWAEDLCPIQLEGRARELYISGLVQAAMQASWHPG